MCPLNLVLLEWRVIGKMANKKNVLFLERQNWADFLIPSKLKN